MAFVFVLVCVIHLVVLSAEPPAPRGRVVAQLLTPQPDHRLLLLAPALRLHNETAAT